MPIVTTAPLSRRRSPLRRGLRFTVVPGATAFLLALSACSSAPPPPPDTPNGNVPSPSVVPAPTAAPASPPEMPQAVIHRSEIYATITARNGAVLQVLSLLMTSETPPPVGTKGLLLRKAIKGESGDWVPIGEVTLQKFGDGGTIELTLGDEKTRPKGEAYKKNTSIKIQIDR